MNSLIRSLILGSVGGLIGLGRIWVLGLVLGFGRILFLRLPLLVGKDPLTEVSKILVQPHLLDAEFCKAWMPFSVALAILLLLLISISGFVGHLLPQEPQFDLPWIMERDLQEAARAKKATASGMVGPGMSLKLFLFLGSLVWLFCLSWLRLLESGLRVYWMLKKP